MNLQEQISRIQEVMRINEFGGGSLEDLIMGSDRENNPYKDKSYNPESSQDFSNSKVKKVVWRAGGLENFNKKGGMWFAENKEDVEKFVSSVRGVKKEGKPYYIIKQHLNLKNVLNPIAS